MERIWFPGILIIFLTLRIISWSYANELDDHDSVRYLKTAMSIENQNFDELKPIDTFFYPSFIALFDLLGLDLETAARSASFFFSIILFFSIFFIGRRIASLKGNLIGLAIISLSPFLINFSFAILSEPAYLGTIYFGMFLFWYSIKNTNLIRAFFIGIIFGLAFSNRSEGIIFLVFIPLLKLIRYLYDKKNSYSLSGLVSWVSLFMVGFSLVAVPIIITVSKQMGEFSINGRTAWEKLLRIPDGRSYEEKINSLDFSPGEVNLSFIMDHPDAVNNMEESANIFSRLKIIINNITDLYKTQLSELVGSFVIIFFGIGLYYLFKNGRFIDLITALSFIFVILLVPCLFLKSFVTRNIAVAAPMIMLVSGIGVAEFAALVENSFKEKKINDLFKNKVSFLLIGIMTISSLGWLNNSIRHPTQNDEYNLDSFSKPISILKNDIIQNKIINPKIITRKSYFTYFSKTEAVRMPFTDYNGLITYARLNEAGYLFLEYDQLKTYPFLERFIKGNHPGFLPVFSGADQDGNKIELYKSDLNYKN